MCGLAGFVLRQDRGLVVDQSSLWAMTRALTHRGPDDEGYYWQADIGLGSRRLSIIDLSSAARMPLFNETGTVAVAQNGEIYNYHELRRDLVSKGHRFQSASDTEVIVHLYEEIGESCFEKLEGMFAIALWDGVQRKLLLARDRFGEKPLYFFECPEGLAFGSELRSFFHFPGFTAELDWDALHQFLTLGYILAPRSPFVRASKLLPGHFLSFHQPSGTCRISQYWFPPVPTEPHDQRTEAEYIEEFDDVFTRSVQSRLISDVPLGAFLSGGIDSSLVVAAMSRLSGRPVRSFSIGFSPSERNDENPAAEEVARSLRIKHQSVRVEATHVFELMGKLPDLCDEPLGDPAYFGVYLLSKAARANGITVMLSGDGGDELFFGYPIFRWSDILNRAYRIPTPLRMLSVAAVNLVSRFAGNSRLAKMACTLRQESFGQASYYLASYGAWSIDELARLTGRSDLVLHNESFLSALDKPDIARAAQNRMYDALLHTYLPDNNLARMDRASMAVSVETRTPFLHPELAEFSARLPARMKLNNTIHKYILRKSLANRVPAHIWQRPKHGFDALPMAQWMRGELKFLLDEYLNPNELRKEGIFQAQATLEVLEQHRRGGRFNHWWKLWLLLVLRMWLKRWGKGPAWSSGSNKPLVSVGGMSS